MVEQILPYFQEIFSACAAWTSSLLDAVGGKGVVLAAFSVVLAIAYINPSYSVLYDTPYVVCDIRRTSRDDYTVDNHQQKM